MIISGDEDHLKYVQDTRENYLRTNSRYTLQYIDEEPKLWTYPIPEIPEDVSQMFIKQYSKENSIFVRSITFYLSSHMKYETLEAYVRANGYELSDLTEDEKKEVEEEWLSIKDGSIVIDDGFFSPLSGFTQRMLREGKLPSFSS